MALAPNFEEFPVQNKDLQILHFGKCLFGRALKFNIQLQNPSAIQANFNCDIFGGSTTVYELTSKKELDLSEKL